VRAGGGRSVNPVYHTRTFLPLLYTPI
jgi:hypothetical protein